MCIVRQLMNKHSIIDSYPKVLVEFDEEVIRQQKSFLKDGGVPGLCDSSDTSSTSTNSFSMPGIIMDSGEEKIAQDVLIFQKIAATMPPKALFLLLNGASRASGMEEAMSLGSADGDDSTIDSKECRRVHFANDPKNANGGVKLTVHEIPRISDPTLWWQKGDFRRIRDDAACIAEHYRQCKPEYTGKVSRLVRQCAKESTMTDGCTDEKKDQILEAFYGTLEENDQLRGLEGHIVYELHQMTTRHVRIVLAAQKNAKMEKPEDDTEPESDTESELSRDTNGYPHVSRAYLRREAAIRKACLYHSRVSELVSQCFAKHDLQQALRCLLSVWESNASARPPLKPTRSKEDVLFVD